MQNVIWVIIKGSCWRIGDGNTAKIWGDNWIPFHHDFKVLTTENSSSSNRLVKDFISRDNLSWDTNSLHSQLLSIDSNDIKQIPLLNTSNKDTLMWMYESNGIYSVKSGYKAIKGWQNQNTQPFHSSSTETMVWKKVWALHTIPRHKIILWRILQNSLPVRSELNKRGIQCSTLCPRCNAKIETITHTFMQCPKVFRIWFGSSLTIKFPEQSNLIFTDWLFDFIIHNDESALINIATILYNIWFARNIHIYEEKDTPEDEIILRADHSIMDFWKANLPNTQAHRSDPLRAPSHPSTASNRSTH